MNRCCSSVIVLLLRTKADDVASPPNAAITYPVYAVNRNVLSLHITDAHLQNSKQYCYDILIPVLFPVPAIPVTNIISCSLPFAV